MIKNSEEIKCIRAAVDVADLGAVRIRDAIRPGVTELDLWSILHQTNIEQGGEWIETQLLCAGARANPWYNPASDKVVQDGELVVFDTDLVGPFGYVGDISRAYLCGDQQPNADQKEAYRIALDMLQHNMSLFKPGVTFRGISETCFVPPEPYQVAALGVAHGAGVEIEFPLIENRNGIDGLPYPDMALEPGMVLCAEAYIGKVGGSVGVKLEQQVVITANGYELLSKSPFDERLLN
ncbi:MAG: aminopeptidase P family protein [Rhodospirillales bacterium]|nr:aminopeptidase P family protein [Rhodospirillales bacterium]